MKIVILGGGESGVGAALLAQAKGFEVFLSDKGILADKYKTELSAHGIVYEEGQHTETVVLSANEIIKSPGIPDKAEIIQKAIALGIPIISEIEFAARYTTAKIVAITGSNGKTTTTSLVYHLLKSAGLNVGLGGNIGDSFAKQVIDDTFDYFVLEVSSFQLDNCYDFKPNISILLNITPDHLDRYQYKFENYAAAKFRIIQAQSPEDFFIYFPDSEPIAETLSKIDLQPKALSVTVKKDFMEAPNTSFLKDDVLNVSFEEKVFSIPMTDLPIKGIHNAINAMCAIQVAQIWGISPDKIREGLLSFVAVPHRLEPVGQINDVRFVNDSKATNVDSVYYALGSFSEKIILIMGGVDKGNDYTQIEDLVKEKVRNLICLGKDNAKLKDFFGGQFMIIPETDNVTDAIKVALSLAQKGDVVLLSPACASFDLFKNYEDRGNQFREAVQKMVL
jgi:UDP-N-acetylmuramoylalanine--D-glutamate ligase